MKQLVRKDRRAACLILRIKQQEIDPIGKAVARATPATVECLSGDMLDGGHAAALMRSVARALMA